MNHSKYKTTARFEATSAFNFPGAEESYKTSVSLTSTGLIDTWFDDFRTSYTPCQAHQIAAGLLRAIMNLRLSLTNAYDRNSVKVYDTIGFWTQLIMPHLPKTQVGVDKIHSQGDGADFVAIGTLRDPAPVVHFADEAQAIYDLSIRPYEGSIMLQFGWVAWMLSPAEAEWLADQLWTAAFLAAKLPGDS
ncbi:TPA: hypothetical protein ACHTCR_005381 [Pseudomonas putida]|uniref:Uncharacterized protein n=1 Tax=Pseudomonas putida TaxID=303 RepID=A0A1L7NG40_PSEPU|nr:MULTISPECIES: hypothetical protein [Pseudomonas]MBH3473116.1 hypothetical protein [Pseudomonas putida]MCE0967299.1 hypothetical protein [Pseudomonas sp. NMI4491_12]MDG9874202.1 hypothetical protein [Pseudomonas juntendi]RNF59840.1 hypothetical protein EFJ98_30870 [Pseudomonas putida]BAW24430.1 Uncharacterized protein KF715C_ch38570 [Pseudomonas putida]